MEKRPFRSKHSFQIAVGQQNNERFLILLLCRIFFTSRAFRIIAHMRLSVASASLITHGSEPSLGKKISCLGLSMRFLNKLKN